MYASFEFPRAGAMNTVLATRSCLPPDLRYRLNIVTYTHLQSVFALLATTYQWHKLVMVRRGTLPDTAPYESKQHSNVSTDTWTPNEHTYQPITRTAPKRRVLTRKRHSSWFCCKIHHVLSICCTMRGKLPSSLRNHAVVPEPCDFYMCLLHATLSHSADVHPYSITAATGTLGQPVATGGLHQQKALVKSTMHRSFMIHILARDAVTVTRVHEHKHKTDNAVLSSGPQFTAFHMAISLLIWASHASMRGSVLSSSLSSSSGRPTNLPPSSDLLSSYS